ncbi:hypothetical protein [Actinokineospora globicatena]|uniref:REase associating with pPIWI RE domain-containing protein n=1 Tax=Actinokineospora globicatena TaxID=103729 RepID=A0A9W6QIE3_9PSEU|nr:hypothetical protein [Actinokineospora globicatena]GLW90626.1 hypothetical protein Aglo03_14420 [Actinokineospora globicatena]
MELVAENADRDKRVNWRRDQAVTACCQAAAALGDPDLPGEVKGRRLMSCLGVLAATHAIGAAPSMARFRAGLRGPLGSLLPDDVRTAELADLRLLDGDGHLTDEAEDLSREFRIPSAALEEHWPWDRVSVEQRERQAHELLRRVSAADYVRYRAYLIEHPVGDLHTLRHDWKTMVSDFYEPVVDWPRRQVNGFFFACPECGWPMRVLDTGDTAEVRCEAHSRHGVIYSCEPAARGDRPPVLRPVGKKAKAVQGQPATRQVLAVSRVVWRYVTLPGLMEIELRDHAVKVNADVRMWPHQDRYDLRIALNGHVWRVDAKAWASPMALGEALRGTTPAAPDLTIVVPDHQRPSLTLLRTMLKDSGYQVDTVRGIKKKLTAAAAVTA